MKIDLLYVPECPNHSLARAGVENALASTGLVALIREQEIRTSEEAVRRGMRGSPTILIDGQDCFGWTAAGSPALACRLYYSDAGSTGAPTVEQLIEVLGRWREERS